MTLKIELQAPGFATIVLAAVLLSGCSSEKKGPDSATVSRVDTSSSTSTMPRDTTGGTTAGAVTPADSVVASPTGSVPTEGMGIGREEIALLLSETKFEKGPDVDGQESYTGKSGPATVELVGPAKNLTRATISTTMDLSDKEAVHSNGYAFGQFTAIVHPAASDWLRENMGGGDYANGFDLQRAFDGRTAHVEYVPLSGGRGMMRLTFQKE